MKPMPMVIAVFCLATSPGAVSAIRGQDAGPGAQHPAAGGSLTARLESLDPSRPLEYFELAEDLADAAYDPQHRHMREHAKHLFALAAVIERDRFGRSSCLALAEMTEDANERRRLLALASLLGTGALETERGVGLVEIGAGADGRSISAVLALGEAFSYHRRGLGSRAQAALDRTGAMQLLQRMEQVVGGTARLIEDIRAMRSTPGGSRPSRVNAREFELMLVELALLEGGDRSWSADLVLTRRLTLIEIDPDRLGEALGIDGTRTVYRNGVWVRPPASERAGR